METSASKFRGVCRTCMLQGHNFNSFSDYADNIKIHEMLAMVVPQLLIISTEPLPTQLCAVCLNTLQSAFKFQQMCIASEKCLRSLLCTDFCTTLPSTSESTMIGQQERNLVLEEAFIKIEADDLAEKSFENIEPVDVSISHPSAISATSSLEKDPLLEENFIKCEKFEMMDTNIEPGSDPAPDVNQADTECRDSYKATGVVDVESLEQETQLSPKATTESDKGIEEIEKPKLHNRRKVTLHCPDCDKVFDRPYRLKRHVGVHDENRPFMCEVCEYRYAAKNQLARHKLTHAEFVAPPEGYKCADCPRRFEKRESLAAHVQIHRKTDSGQFFQCDICPKKFRERTLLAKHAQTHPENQKFKCTECDKAFGVNEHLIQHMNKHKGLKPFICAFCDKGFDHNCHLKAHESTHTGEKPFLCAQCGKSFKTKANLNQHLPRHSSEKRYQCPECPSKFICQSDQIQHTSTHRALKPHVCDTCGSRFTRSTSLTKHKIIHTGERPHKCKECNMTFAFKNHFRRHMRTHTGEKPHKCKFCDRAYSASGDLNKHLRTHVGEKTYRCEQCPEAFKYHLELREHQGQHFKQQKAANDLADATTTEKN